MSCPERKYVKRFDEKSGILHVWPRGTPVFVGEPTTPHPKAADLDEIFGRKPKEDHGRTEDS